MEGPAVPHVGRIVREAARHALSLPGAAQSRGHQRFDPLVVPDVDLPCGTWTSFFMLDDRDGEQLARLPVPADSLDKYRARYPFVRKSKWIDRDGHSYIDVPLSSGVSVGALKVMIDEAYTLVLNKLDDHGRAIVELSRTPYDESAILDRLIEIHGLKTRRRGIRKLARQAILLHPVKSTESKIRRGGSKICGRPDLPKSVAWPAFEDGRPLAFLAQIDLTEVGKLGNPVCGLPSGGLLSVFSAWGWMEPGDGDPHPPAWNSEGGPEQRGWTVVLHTPPRAKLERRTTPRGVNSFRADRVEPRQTLSLPKHRDEPVLAGAGWDEDEYRRFDDLQGDFLNVQARYAPGGMWRSQHLLGGFPAFQQEFDHEVIERGLNMFLQLGSGGHSGMSWGDGGELMFFADPKALAKGRFERVWATYQGG
jgi:hypothetical protein